MNSLQPHADRSAMIVSTPRLELVAVSLETARAAAVEDHARMAALLGGAVSPGWPPDLLDDAMVHLAAWLENGEASPPWSMWFIMLREPRMLIGTCGFKGPPTNGRVDVGYSIVGPHQRRGYATEATRALVEFAFADARVDRVVAETLAELTPSIGVLEKLGFTRCAEGVTGFSGEENVVRFELRRG